MRAREVKIVLVGDSGVGKTAILRQAATGSFDTTHSPTIGGQHLMLNNRVGLDVVFSVWDTAGQEQFLTVVPMYLRGAAVALIIFDLAKEESFRSVDAWAARVRESSPLCAIYLAGNKADLPPVIQAQHAAEAAARIEAQKYFETSAVTGQGVLDMFDSIGKDMCEGAISPTPDVPLVEQEDVDAKRNCGC
jgi:small GTP-binding protein